MMANVTTLADPCKKETLSSLSPKVLRSASILDSTFLMIIYDSQTCTDRYFKSYMHHTIGNCKINYCIVNRAKIYGGKTALNLLIYKIIH